MKTSLGAIAWFAWFILNLSHQGDGEFLEESCRRLNQSGSDIAKAGTWMVILTNRTHAVCAGSLINRRFVLTAAQCIDGRSSLFALIGTNDKLHPAARVAVARASIHRLYTEENGNNDIGLVMLSHKINYTDHIQPICIPLNAARRAVEQIKIFKTFGWGIGTNRKINDTLQEISINRNDQSSCGIDADQASFCAGPLTEGYCGGDIGGPLTISGKINGKIETLQIGIVSFSQSKCAGLRLYTDVTSYVDWIARTVKDDDTLFDDDDMDVSQSTLDSSTPTPKKSVRLQHPTRVEAESRWFYRDCGEMYLMANIYGPDFMAKGVMITHRFVLTTATNLPDDVDSLRVGVEGVGNRYQELKIDSVYKHPEDYKNFIALLKLSDELIPERIMKPICMLKGNMEQSRQILTIMDPDRTSNYVKAIFKGVTPLDRQRCETSIRKTIEATQICVQTPAGLSQVFGIRGNVLSQKIMPDGKYNGSHALFGIVNYSSKGINIVTDVTLHSDWITSVVNENAV